MQKMSNVKLAVRIRPFGEKEIKSEKENSPVVCILDENTVTITNLKVSLSGAGDSRERVRRYHADYTFDSSCPTNDPRYASQDKVFEKLGNAVLSAVERGGPACVLAYGQSATGKTHTMLGSELQPGLVPRLGAALAASHQHITVSFLEIYNERVHDLLAGGAPSPAEDYSRDYSSLPRRRGNARKDLRVREHPTKGPYVQNLRRVVVRDSESLLSVVREGGRRRRTAATRRNPASSRSHALLELATPYSTLYLVDLAGSEKASWEGCGGGRQKESANINKSLVALSNVISALVSSGVGRERFVPYRDSSLTWLLKDCFIGGAATFIIATVSPSVTCYGESASTLRWAARARQLPAPQASRGLQQLTRAALQAQLADILATLAVNHIRYIPETKRLIFDKIECVENNEKNICEIKMDPKKLINADVSKSVSTPSSVASGSSEKIFSSDKGGIVGEVDNLFGPSLGRTRSGSEINIVTPLKNRRRQYRSQEVLPIQQLLKSQLEPNSQNSTEHINELVNKEGRSENEIDNFGTGKIQTHVPLYYDSPRAEIVSSVTERLYSKLKKKEEVASSKMESLVDRKIMEPLNELRICTNARQRLVDLSSKALKNKRRIGIPAHTQTRPRITRVKDQSTDAQWDLEFYIVKDTNCYKALQNVGTETVPLTPRCKEIAVGSKYGFLNYEEKSAATNTRLIAYKNSSTITDSIAKFDRCTQTALVPPPRRKRRIQNHNEIGCNSNDAKSQIKFTPILSINISQEYNMTPDSTSESDETTEDPKNTLSTVPPDLLTNHSTLDNKADREVVHNKTSDNKSAVHCNIERQDLSPTEDLKNSDEHNLPRVTPLPGSNKNKHFENLIMGSNNEVFPLNIASSQPIKRTGSYRKTVKFKDEFPEIAHVGVQVQCNKGLNSQFCGTDSESVRGHSEHGNGSTGSDESNKSESDGFVWEPGEIKTEEKPRNKTTDNIDYCSSQQCLSSNQARYRNSRVNLYREFLGLERELSPLKCEDVDNNLCTDCESTLENEKVKLVRDFKQKRQYFESKIKNYSCRKDSLYNIKSDISSSCDRLEAAANKYDSFMVDIGLRRPVYSTKLSSRSKFDSVGRSPREYLQHLVQVRRNVIKRGADLDNL